MNLKEEFLIAVANLAETATNSPKIAATVGGATASLGVGVRTDLITGALANAGILAGLVMTVLLAGVHYATLKNRALEGKILQRQLEQMGVEPATEKVP
jgi:hypothetical protein